MKRWRRGRSIRLKKDIKEAILTNKRKFVEYLDSLEIERMYDGQKCCDMKDIYCGNGC